MSYDDAEVLQYIKDVKLAPLTSENAKAVTAAFTSRVADADAYVNRGSLQLLPIPQQQTTDALYWTLFSQLAADVAQNREENPVAWYHEYVNTLGRIGMGGNGWSRNSNTGPNAGNSVDATVSLYLKPFLSSAARAQLDPVIASMKNTSNQGALNIFNTSSSSASSANFQVSDGTVDSSLNLTVHIGYLDFKTDQRITNLLFFNWSNRNFTFYYSGEAVTLVKGTADRLRDTIASRLTEYILGNIDDIQL